jgi:hypothetical protein
MLRSSAHISGESAMPTLLARRIAISAVACCMGFASTLPCVAQGKRWIVILVGLPGQPAYEQKYEDVTAAWRKTFEEWGIPATQIIRPAAPLTAEKTQLALADVAAKATAEDSFWLLTLGHGDHDGRHARFHVQGKDPTEEDWPRWLADIQCKEQVVWLTHASSGWLVKPLSKTGRVIIAATEAAAEENETEFPYALAKVWQSPAKDCDANGDGRVSLAELFPRVVAAVNDRFNADKRIPTEHAQLDDNGDGKGSEELPTAEATTPAIVAKDGALAATLILPWPMK